MIPFRIRFRSIKSTALTDRRPRYVIVFEMLTSSSSVCRFGQPNGDVLVLSNITDNICVRALRLNQRISSLRLLILEWTLHEYIQFVGCLVMSTVIQKWQFSFSNKRVKVIVGKAIPLPQFVPSSRTCISQQSYLYFFQPLINHRRFPFALGISLWKYRPLGVASTNYHISIHK